MTHDALTEIRELGEIQDFGNDWNDLEPEPDVEDDEDMPVWMRRYFGEDE